jgi:signal peptidase I
VLLVERPPVFPGFGASKFLPHQWKLFFVKRAIALGGNLVERERWSRPRQWQTLWNEPYASHTGQVPVWLNNFGPVVVPRGEYFVLGDNRDASLDSRSREFGFVSIMGKPL